MNVYKKSRLFISAFFGLLIVESSMAQDITPLQGINDKIAGIVIANPSPGEVQVATLPGVVEWNDEGGRYAFYQLCDVLPTWGPQLRSSGVTLSNRYTQYLLGIKAKQGDVAADQQQMKFAKQAAKAERELEKERRAVLKRWNELVTEERNLPEANKTSYSSFMQHQGAEIAGYEISALNAYSQWQPFAAKAAPSTVGWDLNVMLNPASRVKVKTYSGAELNVLECSPNIDLKSALTSAKARVESKAQPDLVLQYGRQTGEIKQSWQRWGGSGGWGPFSVSASGQRSEVSVVTNNFKLTVEVPVIIRFNLTRPWLDLSVVQTYKDTAILPGSELDTLRPLFGSNGSFSLVPLEFVVAYRPRVTVAMDSGDYKTVKENYEGGGSFSVGPFTVQGGASGGSSVEKWDDITSTVVVGTSADTFVLLATRNRVLP